MEPDKPMKEESIETLREELNKARQAVKDAQKAGALAKIDAECLRDSNFLHVDQIQRKDAAIAELQRQLDAATRDARGPGNPTSPLGEQVGGSHYKGLKLQPAQYCHANGMGYCESAVVRYITRHRQKNGRQDIEKAIHCLHLLLELEYPQAGQTQKEGQP